jgi:hypothetical protein
MGLAIAGAVSGRRVWSTLLDTQVQTKVSVWRWSLDLIRDFPVFGVGRGGFENAFPPYRHPLPGEFGNTAVHVECFPLQWAADWGVPVTLATLAVLGLSGWRAVRRAKNDPVAAGLFTGLCVLFLQNFADLGLELFSVAIAAVVAFACIDSPPDPAPRPRVLGPAQATVAFAALVCVALGASPPQIDRQKAGRAYAALSHAPKAALLAFQHGLEPLLSRHPGDAFFPLLGGLVAERVGANPLPWLGRALERAPLSGGAHLALSDYLAARHARRQSLLHARFAAVYDRGLRDQALARIGSRVRDKMDLEDALPKGLPGSELLTRTCPLVATALHVDCRRMVQERQSSPEGERALAEALVEALERHERPCEDSKRGCAEEALRLLDGLDARAVKDPELAELKARILALQGRPRDAALLLLERCPGGNDGKSCFDRALDLAVAARDSRTIDEIAARYAPLVCADPAACGAFHEHLGRIDTDLAVDAGALKHFLQAAKASPSAERWLLVAETAARLGIRSTASLAVERASRESGLGDEQRQRLAAMQAKLAGASHE